MNPIRVLKAFFCASFVFALAAPASAADIDWGRVKGSRTLLFYPGVASWEFLTGDDHRLGSREIKRGRKECRHCHMDKDGELDLRAGEIASGAARMKRSGSPFEPEPRLEKGGSGLMTTDVRAAYDDEFLYIRVEWESKGASWSLPGGAKKDLPSPDRVSVQMNRLEPSFRRYGCFVACHNDLTSMPEGPAEKDGSSRRLYAFYARDSWAKKKSVEELRKIASGGRIELISAELSGGAAIVKTGSVFDDRVWDDAPDAEAAGLWKGGRYTVVFKKRLTPKNREDVALKPGEAVSAGIAIHDNGGAKRRHFVSFPFTIGLDADADVRAARAR